MNSSIKSCLHLAPGRMPGAKDFTRREGDLNALGRHMLLELKDCNREALNDLSFLREVLLSAAREAGATVVGEAFYRYAPQGISGVVLIAESHIFLHTWPEYGYAAVDIFTCGDTVKCDTAAEVVIAMLQSQNPAIMEVKRGMLVS